MIGGSDYDIGFRVSGSDFKTCIGHTGESIPAVRFQQNLVRLQKRELFGNNILVFSTGDDVDVVRRTDTIKPVNCLLKE